MPLRKIYPFFVSNRCRIQHSSIGRTASADAYLREHAEVGGLMSYGPKFPDMWRRAGDVAHNHFHLERNQPISQSSS